MQSVLTRISEEIKRNKKIAMAMVTKVSGPSPRALGATMGVYEDGTIIGTIGGGVLEATVIKKAQQCLATGESKTFEFSPKTQGESGDACGGSAEVFIRVYNQKPKLLIVGGGHVALELYKLGRFLDFSVSIVEDRPAFCSPERFPEADELLLGDMDETLRNYHIDNNTFIIIVSRGHDSDELALKEVITSNAKYIGMIGNKPKVEKIFDNLREEGVTEDVLNRVYAPIGLALGGREVSEVALAIMAEVTLVKNKGYSSHMKYISR
ncbi:MAG: XdhC/CoxI family protein [Clostridium sp.]|uniref:XdhC family protein n=1 Tax=Clostridium sp. TaxID=1506 RepID=UPI002FCBF6B1